MNEYDSQKMQDVLRESHGLEATDNMADADVILINTCSIREKAQEKVYSELGRYRELKKEKPSLVIGVGGCVASQEGQMIVKRAPFVDLVFGPQTLHRLPDLLSQATKDRRAAIDVSFPEIEKFDRLPEPKANGPSAFVSIMEGCSKYCSFCIVPYTRGEEISRPFDDVIAEVVQLSQQGVKEITLLGQNVNDYRGLRHDGTPASLATLIYYLASLDEITRLRFTTSHPLAFSDELIEAYANVPKLANHLHLPVQSGSDRILAAMKRPYTALEYKSKIRRLRKVRPDISISSDFIVGFPGETDEDFAATMKLIEDVGFDQSFSFVYSRRPGTPAANLPDDVPEAVKKQRLAILQGRLSQQAQKISMAMVGKYEPVLITGESTKYPGQIAGRTENNRVVNIELPINNLKEDLLGKIIPIKITEALRNSLRGQLA